MRVERWAGEQSAGRVERASSSRARPTFLREDQFSSPDGHLQALSLPLPAYVIPETVFEASLLMTIFQAMELRRIGEALLRSHPTTFLTRPCQQRLGTLSRAAPRAYSVSAVRRQQEPAPPSPASAPPNDQDSRKPSQENATPSPKRSASISASLASLLDEGLDFTRSDATKRTSRFSSPGAQAENRDTTNYGFSTGSSAEDAAARFRGSAESSSLSTKFTNMHSTSYMGSGGMGTLDFGSGRAGPTMKSVIEPPDPSTLPRLGPTVGRSVQIRAEAGMDLAKGLRTMEVICGRNKVKMDFYRQKFHERPGLKRKRLASERWRKRFLEGFKASVTRVQYLKRQGW